MTVKKEQETVLEQTTNLRLPTKTETTTVVRNSDGTFPSGKSGNPKGRPKKAVFTAKQIYDRCTKLNCDPIELLCQVANGDSAALDGEFITDKNGDPVLHPVTGEPMRYAIPLKFRIDAAKDLLGYMAGKIRPVDLEDKDDSSQALNKRPDIILVLPGGTQRDPTSGVTVEGAYNIEDLLDGNYDPLADDEDEYEDE